MPVLLGYNRDELPAISFADLWVNPAHKEAFFIALKSHGNIENLETRFHSKIKGDRWVLVSAGKLPDNQFVVTLVDITDRKQAEELLLIKDHAIRSSINAIAILDLDFTITYVNQSLTKMLEYYHEKEFIGKNLGTFMMAKPAFEEIRDTLPQAGSWFGEIVLLKYNKSPFYVLLWANLVKDDTGKPICVMVSFIDITDKKQMEMAKRKALEQIEQNIEQFAILGDHIRNPLAVIVGLSSLAPGDITDKIILQAREIDRIITQLDMGWIEIREGPRFHQAVLHGRRRGGRKRRQSGRERKEGIAVRAEGSAEVIGPGRNSSFFLEKNEIARSFFIEF